VSHVRKRLLSTAEAAQRMNVAEITVRLWRWNEDENQPPYIRIGPRRIGYDPDVLDAWIAARTVTPRAKRIRKRKQ
jgi:predicted DNA-binding transcriptional regulator AlpA